MLIKNYLPLFFFLCLFLTGCITNKGISGKDKKQVINMIEDSPVFADQFTGFVLYDSETKETLIDKNGHKYFTPASNTKIFTLYTALQILGDTLPVLHYIDQDSILIFWGTGNPMFYHSSFVKGNSALGFLGQNKDKELRFSTHNFQDDRFGEGWMWDDYPYGFQVEKSSFPIHGNMVRFRIKEGAVYPDYFPHYYASRFKLQNSPNNPRFNISREEHSNKFEYSLSFSSDTTEFIRELPVIITEEETRKLLSNILYKEVYPAPFFNFDTTFNYSTLYEPMRDTLYRRLMYESDNFVAEQLLLMCSDKIFGIQNTRKIIQYAKENTFTGMPDELLWADGSGISRYNMFTPRTIVEVLKRMKEQFPEERLFNLFPAGGQSGTITSWYDSDQPYIFAKTGTLRNNHCLSGFIKTDSGKVLIFSFMNNHFSGGSASVKREMQQVLEMIRKEF